MVLKMLALENSLVAQWSGLCAFIAGAHIQSLVGQLGCCKLHGAKKKKSINSCILQDPYSQKKKFTVASFR